MNQKEISSLRYIDKPSSLSSSLLSVESSPWAAVDTEGDSLHHYFEKLCLLQVSIPGEDFVIDPLALEIKPLISILSRKPLILHGADFDLCILKKNHGFVPSSIFDTGLAAQLLGYEKEGLADLAIKHCGVVLPKAAQRADWSKRPLDPELLTYAANDTHYLKSISEILKSELEALARLEWHRQTCEKLVRTIQNANEENNDPATLWQIKGSKDLKGLALTVLKELWHWREEEARRRDRPSFKIINSETLIDIAKWAAENPESDVALMPKAPRNVKNEHREVLNRITQKSKTLPQVLWARKLDYKKQGRWTEESKAKMALLKIERDKIGKEIGIQPSLVATNAVLESLALELPKNRGALEALGCFMPWQLDIAASRFLQIIAS